MVRKLSLLNIFLESWYFRTSKLHFMLIALRNSKRKIVIKECLLLILNNLYCLKFPFLFEKILLMITNKTIITLGGEAIGGSRLGVEVVGSGFEINVSGGFW